MRKSVLKRYITLSAWAKAHHLKSLIFSRDYYDLLNIVLSPFAL